jgi:DNA-directed RNA polymerase sigma subunit (sigma70/sigma32)
MSIVWPSDEGWPYPDTIGEMIDLDAAADDDVLNVQLALRHLDGLEPLERQLITSRYGIGGTPVRSMKQLHADTGLPRDTLRQALGSGLAKLRDRLR